MITTHPRVAFKVDEVGRVFQATLLESSGIKEIDEAALEAAKKWKYKPAPSCGIRSVEITFTVDFGKKPK